MDQFILVKPVLNLSCGGGGVRCNLEGILVQMRDPEIQIQPINICRYRKVGPTHISTSLNVDQFTHWSM